MVSAKHCPANRSYYNLEQQQKKYDKIDWLLSTEMLSLHRLMRSKFLKGLSIVITKF